jgi:hyaluronate lyase
MSSRREKAYECINGANQTGWYTGDGATYIYTRYDGNQYDGDNFITKNEAVAYRFPGTTEDSQPRVARSIANRWEWYPENTIAGGMQIDKKYLVACMDYISFSSFEDDVHPDDYGHGGSQPLHYNDLRARKSWFCFDKEVVCLGAGISSTKDSPVHTTVEHRRIVNPAEDIQCLNGEKLPKEDYEKRAFGKAFVNMKGQHEPYYQGFMPIFPPGDHEHRPINTPVLIGQFEGKKRVVTVLYPYNENENNGHFNN